LQARFQPQFASHQVAKEVAHCAHNARYSCRRRVPSARMSASDQ
jgi:hypothetical protein